MQLPQGRDAAQLGGDAAGDRVPAEQQSLQAGQLAELRGDGAGEGVPPEVQHADLREAPQPPREAPPQLQVAGLGRAEVQRVHAVHPLLWEL